MANNNPQHVRRKRRNTHKVVQSALDRPVIYINRSEQHVSVQLIDTKKHVTLASASTVEADVRKGLKSTSNKSAAEKVGQLLAERAKAKGISEAVFNRGSYRFHGRVKAVAEGARAGGLKF